MALVDVRRLAAVDVHGVAGTRRRRHPILAEFTPRALDAALAGVDVGPELWRYSYVQLWIGLPLLPAWRALRRIRRR